MNLKTYLRESVTFTIPLNDRGTAFAPGDDYNLIFTVKRSEQDVDADALIQKASGAGITVATTNALVTLVPDDTTDLAAGTIVYDIRGQHVVTGARKTLASGTLRLVQDIGREAEVSVPVVTSEPPLPFAPTAAVITAAEEKTDPANGDRIPATDSEDGFALKWFSWNTIKTIFFADASTKAAAAQTAAATDATTKASAAQSAAATDATTKADAAQVAAIAAASTDASTKAAAAQAAAAADASTKANAAQSAAATDATTKANAAQAAAATDATTKANAAQVAAAADATSKDNVVLGKVVRHDTAQTLTEAQRNQALENIGNNFLAYDPPNVGGSGFQASDTIYYNGINLPQIPDLLGSGSFWGSLDGAYYLAGIPGGGGSYSFELHGPNGLIATAAEAVDPIVATWSAAGFYSFSPSLTFSAITRTKAIGRYAINTVAKTLWVNAGTDTSPDWARAISSEEFLAERERQQFDLSQEAIFRADGDAVVGSNASFDATSKANAAQAYAIQRANHTGTQTLDTTTDTGTRVAMTPAERTKLSGIATAATANSPDATLLNRANHTGTQAQSTVVNLVSDLAAKETPAGAQAKVDVESLARTIALADTFKLSRLGVAGTNNGGSGTVGAAGDLLAPISDIIRVTNGSGGNNASAGQTGNGGKGGGFSGATGAFSFQGGKGGNASSSGNGGAGGYVSAGTAELGLIHLRTGDGGASTGAQNGGSGGFFNSGQPALSIKLGNGGVGNAGPGGGGGWMPGGMQVFGGTGGNGSTTGTGAGGSGGILNYCLRIVGGAGGNGADNFAGGSAGNIDSGTTGGIFIASGNGGSAIIGGAGAGGGGGTSGALLLSGGNGGSASVSAAGGAGGAGGVIKSAGGNGAAGYAGGAGGSITMIGSNAVAGTVAGAAAGSLTTSANGARAGGSVNTSAGATFAGGDINLSNGQNILTIKGVAGQVGHRVAVPATSATTGEVGQWASDDSYFYYYGATGWRRIAGGSF